MNFVLNKIKEVKEKIQYDRKQHNDRMYIYFFY